MITALVLFGASGDLAGRFLLPALAALFEAKQLPDDFVAIGAARQNWDDETFRHHAEKQLKRHAAGVPVSSHEKLLRALRYRSVDFNNPRSIPDVMHADPMKQQPAFRYRETIKPRGKVMIVPKQAA